MRLAFSLLIVLCFVPMLRGQDSSGPPLQDEKVDQEVEAVLEMIRKLDPPNWTYADLVAKSDLVVIAKVKARSEIEWADDIGGDFGKETTNIMIANRLQVLSVLKGRPADEIEVSTLGWKPDVVVFSKHDFAELRTELLLPDLVSVEVAGNVIGYAEVKPSKMYKIEPEYLLYLRRISDGKYVPVTGQRYSGMSVRMLNN